MVTNMTMNSKDLAIYCYAKSDCMMSEFCNSYFCDILSLPNLAFHWLIASEFTQLAAAGR